MTETFPARRGELSPGSLNPGTSGRRVPQPRLYEVRWREQLTRAPVRKIEAFRKSLLARW